MGVKLSMTTAHRAQADGQTERQNLVLKDALRCLVAYSGEKWVKLLGTVEYAHATSVNPSTKLTPFEIDTGRKVSNSISHEYKEYDGLGPQPISELASKFAKDRQDVVRKARKNLEQAQERQKKYYDSKRTNLTFNVGDLVLLDTKNLPLRTVNAHIGLKKAKLAAKKVGPFEIIKMINPNVAKLKLPRNLKKLHSSFNVDLLFTYKPNASEFAGRPIPKTSPVILEADTGKELHIVERLLSRRQRSRQIEWLVKWHGLPECDSTWEREKAIRHVSHWQRLV
ncbi:unnamed protein product [Peronospora farinosa]|uniref:Chromo domain-containing protein n=1 Tax=Peronospora farinosa TaxID=134698 RepID=A0AAV0T0B1_9STRA|nr:unnamed protein product [Peronospora farinosa]